MLTLAACSVFFSLLDLFLFLGMEIASCGSGCLLGILAVCVFVLTTIGSIVVCWRLGKVHKVRGKFNSDHNDLSAPLSDYIDRGLLPENAITLNFDMTTSLAHNTKVTVSILIPFN